MTMIVPSLGLVLLTQTAATEPETGQETVEAESISIAEEEARFEFRVVAGAWIPRLGGEVVFGPGDPEEVSLENEFGLDSSEAVLNLELSMRKHDAWQLDLNGFDFSTEADGVYDGPSRTFGTLGLSPGDSYETSFDITSAAFEVALWKWKPIDRPHTVMRAGPGFGLRYIDVDHTLTIAGEGREEAGGEWLAPYAGLHLQMHHELDDSFPLGEAFQINGALGVGPALGGDGGLMAHIRADMTLFVTDNLGLTFGYRLLEMSVENDDYELTGGLQGLFFAGTIEF